MLKQELNEQILQPYSNQQLFSSLMGGETEARSMPQGGAGHGGTQLPCTPAPTKQDSRAGIRGIYTPKKLSIFCKRTKRRNVKTNEILYLANSFPPFMGYIQLPRAVVEKTQYYLALHNTFTVQGQKLPDFP